MFYKVCPYCQCNLDPGERCECRDEAEARRKEQTEVLDYTNPQVRFRFDEMQEWRKTG